MKYGELAQRLINQPMALLPERLNALRATIVSHQADDEVDPDEIRSALGMAARANPRAPGAVAVVPFVGYVQQRADWFTRAGLGLSVDAFAQGMRAIVSDPNVKAVVIDVNSPGGEVGGVQEASDVVYSLRGAKPIVAVSNTLMASAAYYVASAADEVIASPSSMTGSIGVWTLLVDESEFWSSQGIKLEVVRAGKYKAIGNPFEPITDEVRARFQARVDEFYGQFVAAVARNRGRSVADVRGGFGEGDVAGAQEAVKAGLADRVATLEQTIARFGGAVAPSAPMRAEAQRDLALARFRAPVDAG